MGKNTLGAWIAAHREEAAESGTDLYELICCADRLTAYVYPRMECIDSVIGCILDHLPESQLPEEQQRAVWEGTRGEFVDQLAIALDEIGYLLAAVGCTGAELDKRRQARREANTTEQEAPNPKDPCQENTPAKKSTDDDQREVEEPDEVLANETSSNPGHSPILEGEKPSLQTSESSLPRVSCDQEQQLI